MMDNNEETMRTTRMSQNNFEHERDKNHKLQT